jgi:hypothetical protein
VPSAPASAPGTKKLAVITASFFVPGAEAGAEGTGVRWKVRSKPRERGVGMRSLRSPLSDTEEVAADAKREQRTLRIHVERSFKVFTSMMQLSSKLRGCAAPQI